MTEHDRQPISTLDETAAIAADDAALADAWTEGRVLALAARLRDFPSLPVATVGTLECYIGAYLRACGMDMSTPWWLRNNEYVSVARKQGGQPAAYRYADDLAQLVFSAVTAGEDVATWLVTLHRGGSN